MSATVRMERGLVGLVLICVLAGSGAGCRSSTSPVTPPVIARVYLEADARETGKAVVLPQSGVTLQIAPKPVLMEFDFIDVQEMQVPLGRCLAFRLTIAAGRDLFRLTGRQQGRRLVLTLNDEVLGARRIDQAIDDGLLLIFLEVPDERLPALAQSLRSTSTEIQHRLARKQ
ncbi:MAG: hypothetical protein JNN01_18325 [Opitutaceae bacterium]|nr:hypothetical protein [Opitutaceae bacterium]